MNSSPSSWWRSWVAGVLAVVYLGAICRTQALGYSLAVRPDDAPLGAGLDSLISWLKQVSVAATIESFLALPLGILLVIAWTDRRRRPSADENTSEDDGKPGKPGERRAWPETLLRVASKGTALIVSSVALMAAAVLWMHSSADIVPDQGVPRSLHFLLLVTACLCGAAAAWLCFAGRNGRRLLAGVTLLLLAGLGGAAWYLPGRIFETEALTFEAEQVTSEEKRRIVDKLKQNARRRDDRRHIQFDEHDLNVLMSWALTIGKGRAKGRVDLDDRSTTLLLSARLPSPPGRPRYINTLCKGEIRVDRKGELQMSLDRLVVGDLEVSRFVRAGILFGLESLLRWNEELREGIEKIEKIELKATGLTLVAFDPLPRDGEGASGSDLLKSLIRKLQGTSKDLKPTRAHVRNLLAKAAKMPRDRLRLEDLVAVAFEHAAHRCKDGKRNPIAENRAAILALAILLGHRRVETLVGPVMDQPLHEQAMKHIRSVRLRKRLDWTKHYLVSAALVVISSKVMSDAAGLLKEELDAGQGGSGFSFSDLLADLAGTRMAKLATRNKELARRMQRQLAPPLNVDAIFPPAADLPEGIRATEIEAEYGGVGGAKYRQMLETLERRLAACAALKDR